MPNRPKKPCNKAGCPELIEAGNTYCDKHRQERHNKYTEIRDKKKMKFYASKQWKCIRNRKIYSNPLCEECKKNNRVKQATEVHHIIPIEKDWSLRLKYSNLQSLCHSCHMKKH